MAVFPSLHRLLTQFLRLAAILLATFFATARAADTQPGAKPNIIFLLIDALGFADCGFNGGKDIRTPNIDRLAHGGAILDSLYVQPVCPPIPNRRRNRRSTPRGQSADPAAVATLPREFGSCDRCGPPFTLSPTNPSTMTITPLLQTALSFLPLALIATEPASNQLGERQKVTTWTETTGPALGKQGQAIKATFTRVMDLQVNPRISA